MVILRRGAARSSLIGLLSLLSACRSTPDLHPRFNGYPVPLDRVVRDSPIILVGSISRVELDGAPARTVGPPGFQLPVKLTRIDLDVEVVLRGDVQRESVSFDTFMFYGPDYPGALHEKGVPISQFFAGNRRVFFLTREEDGMRTMLDVGGSTIGLSTGKPVSDIANLADTTIEEKIAKLLLTPTPEADDESFAKAIHDAVSDAITLVGDTKTSFLLRALLNHRSSIVRATACLELADYFEGQYSCIEVVLRDPSFSEAQGWRGGTLLEKNENSDAWMRDERFQKDPWLTLLQWSGTDLTKLIDQVLLLTYHQDSEIKGYFCGLIQREMPAYFERSGCTEKR